MADCKLEELITIESVTIIDHNDESYFEPSEVLFCVDLIFNELLYYGVILKIPLKGRFGSLSLSDKYYNTAQFIDKAGELGFFPEDLSKYIIEVTGAKKLWNDYIISKLRHDDRPRCPIPSFPELKGLQPAKNPPPMPRIKPPIDRRESEDIKLRLKYGELNSLGISIISSSKDVRTAHGLVKYKLSLLLDGKSSDYINKLINMLDDDTPNTLLHPTLGKIEKLDLASYSFSEDNVNLKYSIEITFENY